MPGLELVGDDTASRPSFHPIQEEPSAADPWRPAAPDLYHGLLGYRVLACPGTASSLWTVTGTGYNR